MSMISTNIRIDEQLKKEATELFNDLGMNFSQAITIFLKQSVREQAIPFKIEKNKYSTISNEELDDISFGLISENQEAYKELAK